MVIQTKYGPMPDHKLEARLLSDGVIEYYLNGELVHRSASVKLTGLQAQGTAKA